MTKSDITLAADGILDMASRGELLMLALTSNLKVRNQIDRKLKARVACARRRSRTRNCAQLGSKAA